MEHLIAIIPALPLAGFLLLVLGRSLPRRAAAGIGIGSVGAAAAAAIVVAVGFLRLPPQENAWTQTLWQWIAVDGFRPAIAFRIDGLSMAMVLVVTVVSFLIHVYSAAYMAEEEGFGRFFAYMNLFVASMLILVLADNLLLLYLGWEGVGMCSYLLIGFWYKDRANGRAAMKAFLVTRVGDVAMAVGLFLLFFSLGTLDIQPMMDKAAIVWKAGSGNECMATAAALLLLGGAVGKSAQLPLQTWLPDAMAGPTPVSALIHAATMVTAGVYLIARTHTIFELAPAVQNLVAVIGAATLLLAGFSALVQRDIKRVLAYSTISQIGYMFLALGVGAWSAALFHFMTHAFFKSLLFLAAGAVIVSLHHEQDMFKMGGLRKRMPLVFWTFLIGACSLSALPLVTAGFYSKDLILAEAWTSSKGSPGFWLAGLAGAMITSVYTFRMVFLTFFGPVKQEPHVKLSRAMTVPLLVLAGLSVVGGSVQMPVRVFGVPTQITTWDPHEPLFSFYVEKVLPYVVHRPGAEGRETVLQLISAAACLAGILIAWLLFLRKPALVGGLLRVPACDAIRRFWLGGWGFDWLYERLFVRPVVWLARVNKGDVLDLPFRGAAGLSELCHRFLSRTQTGHLGWYAACLAAGAVVILAALVWL
jgi:NADH-quinone oxidoreductase subunit L